MRSYNVEEEMMHNEMKKTQMTSMFYKLMRKQHQQKPFEAWKQAKTTHIIRKHRQHNEKNVIEKDCKWQ